MFFSFSIISHSGCPGNCKTCSDGETCTTCSDRFYDSSGSGVTECTGELDCCPFIRVMTIFLGMPEQCKVETIKKGP